MPIKSEIKENFTGTWAIGMFETPCKAPAQFCYGCCCPCIMVCGQRFEVLDITGEPYVCCGGLCPCGPLGDPQDRNCMYLEGCCCTGMAISGNRFMIQTRFNKMNTACDDCIICFACVVSWVRCILACFIDIPEEIEHAVDLLLAIVDGCMLAQQAVELKAVRNSGGYAGPPQHIIGLLPPKTQNMMMQGKPQQVQMGQPVGNQQQF